MKYVFDLFLTTMKQTHTHEINRKKDKMSKLIKVKMKNWFYLANTNDLDGPIKEVKLLERINILQEEDEK